MIDRRRYVLLVLLVFVGGCAATKGDGVSFTEMRMVSDPFDAIRVSDGLVVELTLTTSNVGAVDVTSDANLVPLIETTVADGVLEISAGNIEPMVSTVIQVSMATLSSASAANEGSSIIVADIDRTGVGAAGTIAIGLSEGASADLSGMCTELIAIVSGESTLRASALECHNGELDVLDGASVEAHLTDRVVVRASGPSTIRITGAPPDVDQSLSDDVSLTVE